jgi:hypothetical protein
MVAVDAASLPALRIVDGARQGRIPGRVLHVQHHRGGVMALMVIVPFAFRPPSRDDFVAKNAPGTP